jgi:predicted MFS family arabinose efflux permease
MSSNEATGRPLSPGYALWRTLVGGIPALVVAIGIGRFAYTPILPVTQERFDLTNTAVAALASSNYVGYLLGAVFAAFVPASRWRNTLLQASLLTVAASTGFMALSVEFAAWLALRFFARVASAGVLVLASTVVLSEFARLGRPGFSGWLYSGVGLGIVLSGLVILPLNRLLSEDPAAWQVD